jgi:hypothetical protein
MIYHTYLPRSPLLHFVAFLWSSEGDNLPKAQVRLLPIGSIELVINLRSDAIALFDQHSRAQCGSTNGSRLCGIHSESLILDNDSQICVMSVRFKPGGSAPFFALPAGELHNQIVSLDELWHHRAAELRHRLLSASTIKTRFLILEHFLLTMAQPPKRHPAVVFCLKRV